MQPVQLQGPQEPARRLQNAKRFDDRPANSGGKVRDPGEIIAIGCQIIIEAIGNSAGEQVHVNRNLILAPGWLRLVQAVRFEP